MATQADLTNMMMHLQQLAVTDPEQFASLAASAGLVAPNASPPGTGSVGQALGGQIQVPPASIAGMPGAPISPSATPNPNVAAPGTVQPPAAPNPLQQNQIPPAGQGARPQAPTPAQTGPGGTTPANPAGPAAPTDFDNLMEALGGLQGFIPPAAEQAPLAPATAVPVARGGASNVSNILAQLMASRQRGVPTPTLGALIGGV